MRERLGVTGVVITHDMRSAYTVGTRIAMLYEGRVRWQGTIDEIHHTDDPVVRQFVEGKPTLDAGTPQAGDADPRAPAVAGGAGAPVGSLDDAVNVDGGRAHAGREAP
jgi:phospholipid/cholesterol/gamma-HCH transport system ATP-binding protein